MGNNTLKVAGFEIIRQLKKPAFWIATLMVPLIAAGIYLISFLSTINVKTEPDFDENTKIAITDEAGVLSANVPYIINGDKEYGLQLVKDGEVDLYYYIPADFAETRKAEFYHIAEGMELFNQDAKILNMILTQDVSSRVGATEAMVLAGDYEVVDNKLTPDGEDSNALGKTIVPLFIGLLFFMSMALCGNRFLMTVVEEKENRISEMILTSISARHLIVGKIIAMLVLGVVQIIAFVVPVLILVFLKRGDEPVASILAMIEIDPWSLCLTLLLFAVSMVLFAGVCVFVGSLVSTARDASSFIGPALIVMIIPLYFIQQFALEPTLVVQVFSYFPLSAPIALMLRNGFGTISTPEFCIGIGIVAISAAVSIRLAIMSFQKNAINFGIAMPRFLQKKSK